MSKNRFGFVLFITLLLLLAFTTACLQSPLTQTTPLTVMGTLESKESDVVEARIIVSRGNHLVETTVPVNHNEFEGTVNLPVGQWELTVLLVDADGIVRFQSKPQSTRITFNEPSIVELVLYPAAGTVTVRIDLENYIFRNETLRARIHFDDEIHEVTRSSSSEPLEKKIEMLPGSYEFKIELYTESFRVGDRLGQGAWRVIHISENEDLLITWSPDTEALQISGRVETLLPAPENLMIDYSEGSIVLTWEPVIHWEVTGYFLFAQSSPLERFQLLNPLPVETANFVHVLDWDPLPTEIRYVVAAVSSSGLVGYYSEPQMWRRDN
ncbi:MAG: hypothetical protein GX971_00185 [Firmicutes bacterium]|nr:hypothetical protein [Bacillota bacterium]